MSAFSARLSLGFIWSAIGREPTKTKARACRPYTPSLMLIGMNWPAPLPHKPIVVIPGQAARKPSWSGRATRHTRAAPTLAARLCCYPADSGIPARAATNDAERIAPCQHEWNEQNPRKRLQRIQSPRLTMLACIAPPAPSYLAEPRPGQ
jgi:hypothetical protein